MSNKKAKRSLMAGKKSSRKKVNRTAFLIFTVSFSCLMVLGSTYAWLTSADSATNEFEGTRLAAEIEEKFKPNYTWSPGTDTVKEVWVKNTGDTPAFIRVSMDEFLVSFEMDIKGKLAEDGTGNVLLIEPKPATATIDRDKPLTWKKGEYYQKGKSPEYYRAKTTVPTDLEITGKGYRVGLPADISARATSDLKYTTLTMGEVLPAPSPTASKYWIYGEDGYYYYSERLEPGEKTSWLLEKTSLSASLPNRLKDSLYQIDIKMDAQQPVTETFSDWSHSESTDPVYLMLKDKVQE